MPGKESTTGHWELMGVVPQHPLPTYPNGFPWMDPRTALSDKYTVIAMGQRNAARFPANHRIDLDASRAFQFRGATVSPYVSVANAYNAQNVFVYLYDDSTDYPTRRAISQFPVLPSVGVRVVF